MTRCSLHSATIRATRSGVETPQSRSPEPRTTRMVLAPKSLISAMLSNSPSNHTSGWVEPRMMKGLPLASISCVPSTEKPPSVWALAGSSVQMPARATESAVAAASSHLRAARRRGSAPAVGLTVLMSILCAKWFSASQPQHR